MSGISFFEIMMVIVVAIIVFGKDLPQIARKVARGYGKIRRYLSDVKDELSQHLPEDEINDVRRDIQDAAWEAEQTARIEDQEPEEAPTGDFDPADPASGIPDNGDPEPEKKEESSPQSTDPGPQESNPAGAPSPPPA